MTFKNGIPKKFQLLGHTITVRIVPKSRWRHRADVGYWDYSKLRIDIVSGQPDSVLAQTFCHEWAHAMLTMMAHPLAESEPFVDQLGHLLQQSLSTFEDKDAGKSQ